MLCTLQSICRNNTYLVCMMNQTYLFASKCIFLSAKQAVRSHSLIDFKATFCMYGNWSFDHSLLCEVIHEVTPHRCYLHLYCMFGDKSPFPAATCLSGQLSRRICVLTSFTEVCPCVDISLTLRLNESTF